MYCQCCTVVPVLSNDTVYCDHCIEDIMEWLWQADLVYVAQLQQRHDDMVYVQQANGGM